jgi:hypothetical protein
MSFLREVFSEPGGAGSASRVMMAFHAFIGSIAVLHVSIHNHVLPDAVTMAGVTAFVSAPYAVNKFGSAIAAFAPSPKP